MYCKNCGKEIDDKAVMCPHCGVVLDENFMMRQQQPASKNSMLVTVAKVFIVLGMVVGALYAVILLIFAIGSAALSNSTDLVDSAEVPLFTICAIMFAIVAIIYILGLIFGVKAFKKINAKTKPSVALSIGVLIFTNLIAGILLLCTKDSDY